MNAIRALFSVGITIGCLLNWIDIGVIKVSGINWTPGTFLLFAALLTSGYAFHNSYNNTNQNTWVYLITGLFGIGICIYGYVFVTEKMGYVDMFLETQLTEIWLNAVGPGFYLTGLCSIILFFLGFDKSDSKNEPTQVSVHTQANSTSANIADQTKSAMPTLQEWSRENPGKSINDYFSKYRKM